MRGVLANRRRTADTPNLTARGRSVSWKTFAEVPLNGLSFTYEARGVLSCHRRDSCSLVAADGRLLAVGMDGTLQLIQPDGDRLQVLASARLISKRPEIPCLTTYESIANENPRSLPELRCHACPGYDVSRFTRTVCSSHVRARRGG